MRRIKKFRPGSLVGELSSCLSDKKRIATIVAGEDTVLCHLSSKELSRLEHEDL